MWMGLHLLMTMCFVSYPYRLIIEKEGPAGLFKGLGPNIVGVAPSRAIYFCAYSQSKKTYNTMFPNESPIVHICSAATAGIKLLIFWYLPNDSITNDYD